MEPDIQLETKQEVEVEKAKEFQLTTPMAIIVAGIFIALAVYLTSGRAPSAGSAMTPTAHPVPVFTACLESGKYASKIQADVADAQTSGGTGTPWTIVVGPTGIKYPISGALPYDMVKKVVDDAIAGKPATSAIANTKASNPSFDPSTMEKMVPVTSADHIRGNANAKVMIVEYSDLECPFCKVFHSTLKQVMTDYSSSNNVAWVYRHFPLDSLHPRSRHESEAAECAFAQGGDSAFFAYVDRVYEVTTSNNTLDPLELPVIASYVGLK